MCIQLPGVMGRASEMGVSGAAHRSLAVIGNSRWPRADGGGNAPPPACAAAPARHGQLNQRKVRAGALAGPVGTAGSPSSSYLAAFYQAGVPLGLDAALARRWTEAWLDGACRSRRSVEGAGGACLVWPMPEPA